MIRLRPILFLAASLSTNSLTAAQCEREMFHPGDTVAPDVFSYSLAASGTTCFAGAVIDDAPLTDSGSVYVFERIAESWVEFQKLVSSAPANQGKFGNSVSTDGDFALIGAPSEYTQGIRSGAAYVYRREAGAWVEVQRLLPDEPSEIQVFGESVALLGNRALIGAYGDSEGGDFSGAAYVFERSGGNWVQTAKLVSDDPRPFVQFGFSVALDADRAVVGEPGPSHDFSTEHGAVYVFEREGTGWDSTPTKLVASDGADADNFGLRVAIAGNLLVTTGDRHADDGAAWVFERTGSGWVERQKLIASDVQFVASFGQALDISPERILVGDRNRYDGSTGHVGAAYLFERDGGAWVEIAKLVASDAGGSAWFGQAVLLHGSQALIGAQRSPTLGHGAVYVVEVEAGRSSRYCTSTINSSGLAASLDATGTFTIASNDTTLHVAQAPPFQWGQFFYGAAAAQIPFGNGYLCVSPFEPGLFRLFPLVSVEAGGTADLPLDLTSLGGDGEILAWSSWYFQFWFRDPAGGGSNFNLSDGARLGFCP